MKTIVFFSLFILSFILHTCNPEKKEIRGTWIDQKKSSSTFFLFYKDGSYRRLVYEKVSTNGKEEMVFQDGSIGYYKYVGYHKFDLFEVDVDLSPILGKSVMDPAIGVYLDNFLKAHSKPDLDSAKPSFLAQIQDDGEHLHILQNDEIIIELKWRQIKFGDKR
jgi:hypothetical protein